jgi:hypothetical protein
MAALERRNSYRKRKVCASMRLIRAHRSHRQPKTQIINSLEAVSRALAILLRSLWPGGRPRLLRGTRP